MRPSVDPHLPFAATLTLHKTVILSERLTDLSDKEMYSAKPKDPGDVHLQMLFGAFRPQTVRKD